MKLILMMILMILLMEVLCYKMINITLGEYQHIPKSDSGTAGPLTSSMGIAVYNHRDLQAYLGYFNKRTEKLEEMLSCASDKIGNPGDMHIYIVAMAYNMIGSSEVAKIQDDAKNALAADFTWGFTTATATEGDTTAPTISEVSPVDGSSGAALTSSISATFDEGMDLSTLSFQTFTLSAGSTAIAGALTYSGKTVTLFPLNTLSAGTTYTATITTGVQDSAGNAIAENYVWTFTTGGG